MGKEERRIERQQIYNTTKWKNLRDYMKMTYPLCQDCLKQGIIKAAEEVHHIKSPFVKGLTEDEVYRRAYSVENLVCLCRECHIKRHHPEGTIQDKLKKYAD